MARSPVARLTDIVEAIELLREEMAGVTLAAFERDRRKRWLVERGIEIVSEASRHLGADLKARHPEIPWPKVAGIGNVLRVMPMRPSHMACYGTWCGTICRRSNSGGISRQPRSPGSAA